MADSTNTSPAPNINLKESISTTRSLAPAPVLASNSDKLPSRKRVSPVRSANFSSTAIIDRETSRAPISPRPGKRARLSPRLMTAAAAVADQQRKTREREQVTTPQTSPNPAKQALGALMGIDSASSKSKDGTSATNTISEPLSVVADSLQTPSDETHDDHNAQTSPVSLSSFVTMGSAAAPTAPAEPPTVDSPTSMDDVAPENDGSSKLLDPRDGSPDGGNKALSYPGPLAAAHLSDPRRGMSLPHSGMRQGSPRSPSAKKHRCPYCSTEFTRHHNLKSHLLTHSQEKPFVCQTCNQRFRRLHDLKRHTKLHTGERPHICPKCGRKFARGDALARHNKGPGGCAGRRASMGSYGGDDDYDGTQDDSMDGLVYTVEPDRMEDEDADERRQSMPTIKRHDAPEESSRSSTMQSPMRQPSTYPPIQGRPPGGVSGGLFPPPTSHGTSSTAASPLSQSSTLQHSGAPSQSNTQGSTVFPQAAMTESPKPLSPGAPVNAHGHTENSVYRNRSPSLTQQYQHQMFGRGSGRGRTPPSGVGSLPPPQQIAPQLPPPHGLNPPDARFTLHSQATPTHPPAQPTGPPTHMSGGPSSNSNSLSSHGRSHPGSGEGPSLGFPSAEDRLWEVVRSLENRVNSLQQEVTDLKGQLAAAAQPKTR